MDRFNKGSSKSVMKCLATRRDWLAKGIGVLAGGALGPVLPVVAQPVWGRFAYKPNQGKGPNGVRIINGTPVLVVQEAKAEDLGAAIGKLALEQAKAITNYPKSLIFHFKVQPLWPFLVGMGERMVKKFPERFQAELEAMQRHSGASRAIGSRKYPV